ncbi:MULTISPECIES: hypothetical protein [Oceanithermus]|uniref:Uncharacterized protein n=3 Tax=Oceanithermus TaxID=208447 RepID=E4U9R1_OCEP5|nr:MULTISPECIES: hypothetical protein [Oceanithermus]ADR37225.1 hypothetical protein Ocepr_1772 [Oceanithermus profundus DSM 14977]MBB6030136.1 hypothetical protein [Oceanithermus desulfurans]GEM88694.1 hypothetical protein ODE01S_01280 [Oceanithermus desulfurans NBRC 100063]
MKVFAYTIHKDPGPNGPNMELHQTLDNLGGSKRKTVEWMVETDLEARPVKKELLKRLENGEAQILALGHLHHLFASLEELKAFYDEIMVKHGVDLVSWGAGLDTRIKRGLGSERTLEEFLMLLRG